LFFAFLLFANPQEKIIEKTGGATFEWGGQTVGGTAVGGTTLSGLAGNKKIIGGLIGGICLVFALILIVVAKKRKNKKAGKRTEVKGETEDTSGKELGLSEEDINKLFEGPDGKQAMGMSLMEETQKNKKVIQLSESKPMIETSKEMNKKSNREEQEMILDIQAPTPKAEADISKVASIKVNAKDKPSVYLGDVMTKIDSKMIKIDYKIIKAKIIEMLKSGFPMNRIIPVLLEKGVDVDSINHAITEINNENLRYYILTCAKNGVGLNYAHKVLLSKGWNPEQIKRAEAVLFKKK
jgi:hypothetical protein